MSTQTAETTPQSKTRAGVFWSRDAAITADAIVDVGENSPAAVWQALAARDRLGSELVESVRMLCAKTPHADRVGTLLNAGVTAIDGGYARLVVGMERAPETDAHQRALDLTAQLGQDGMSILGHVGLDAVADGPIAVLEAADRHPTVAVRVSEAFRERPRQQRERTLELLATLGTVCEVRLVCGRVTARWLAENHREQLPASVSERLNAGRREDAPVNEVVATARDELDPEGRAVGILRQLDAEPTETLPKHDLEASHNVSASRIRQLLGDLQALDLVEQYGPRGEKHISLRPPGQELVDTLDAEIARQQALDDFVSDVSSSSDEGVSSTRTRGEGETVAQPDRRRHRTTAPHRLRWLGRLEREAVTAVAPENGVALVDHPIEPADEDRNAPLVDYDDDRDLLLVGEEYDNPMSSLVTLAHAATHRRVWGRIGLEERLADEAHGFQELFGDHDDVLRQSRCLGWFPDEVSSPSEFLAELADAREELLAMTRKLAHEEYDDRTRFRTAILRHALGLAGVMAHVFDLVDVEIVRLLRVPRFDDPDSFDEADRRALAERVAYQAAVESRYRQFAAYRSLFDDRDRKRSSAILPDVDAADPFGQLIGRFALVGPGMDGFEDRLRRHLSQPGGRDVVEDAPEFAVRVPIETADRQAYAEAMQPVASRKNLRLTDDAVTLVQALTGSVYDAVRALNNLKPEDYPREIRHDEVRVALAVYARRTSPDRLLPDADPSASDIVAALLQTDRPLTKTEIADAADVANSSVTNHLPMLESMGLVTEVAGGYRFQLPFATDDERGREILPEPVDGHTTAQELLFDVALDAVDAADAGRLGDPNDPLGAAFFGPRLDAARLRDHCPWLDPWISVAKALCHEADPPPATAEFGAEIEQTSVQAVDKTGVRTPS